MIPASLSAHRSPSDRSARQPCSLGLRMTRKVCYSRLGLKHMLIELQIKHIRWIPARRIQSPLSATQSYPIFSRNWSSRLLACGRLCVSDRMIPA